LFNHWIGCLRHFKKKFGVTTNVGWLLVVGTLQNFIHNNIVDLENVQGNKKKEKGEFTRCQN
jgi:hypothetical protein